MALINPTKTSHMVDHNSSRALISPTTRTNSNLVEAHSTGTSNTQLRTSSTVRISSSQARTPSMEPTNNNPVRTSNMAVTLLSPEAPTVRSTTRSLLRLLEVLSMDSMDSRVNNISPLLLDSNHSISRPVRATLILNPTAASSVARLINMLIRHKDIVHHRLQALRTSHLLRQEDLLEDTTLPTMEDRETSSLMVVSRNTAAAPLLCLTAPTLNNTEEPTEGLHRSYAE
jgi:hypothetical protein